MRVQLIAVGRLKSGPERDLVERYRERSVALARGLGFSGPDVVEIAEGRGRRPEDRQADEASRMVDRALLPAFAIFDEHAPSPSSDAFAERLATLRDAGRGALVFAIGGPDGFEPQLRARAEWSIGFGRLTMPHQLVRALALEQIYRAFTIMAGHPYHRGGGAQG